MCPPLGPWPNSLGPSCFVLLSEFLAVLQIQAVNSGSVNSLWVSPKVFLEWERCSQDFWGVPPSPADCRGHLWGSRVPSSSSCSSTSHDWKSLFVQCYKRKGGTRALLAESFGVTFLPSCTTCLYRPKPHLWPGLQPFSSCIRAMTPLYP